MSRIAQQLNKVLGIDIDKDVVRRALEHGYQFLLTTGEKRRHLHTLWPGHRFVERVSAMIRRETRLLRIKEERSFTSAEKLNRLLSAQIGHAMFF